jgi:beta-lactamase regulating signal transducer with metallopeptidase domain
MEYLLKSVLCLLLLLLFHRLVLQQEVLYRFNRFFLLAAVIGSFLIPFITVEVEQEVVIAPIPTEVFAEEISSADHIQDVTEMPVLEEENSEKAEVPIPWQEIGWTVYLIGVVVFLIRFLRNLRSIYQQVQGNHQVTYRQETLVLLPELVSPFSFLKYIFFSKSPFEKEGMPEAVFLHEQCHVHQKHTWDVLLVEALLVVFWFHPGLYLTRQAIRLNHEFIADQQVIQQLPVSEYQSLLLAILSGQQGFALGSSLNFSLTKKRFAMMKKTSKPRIQVLKLAALMVFLGVTVVLFAEKEAVSKPIQNSVQNSDQAESQSQMAVSSQIVYQSPTLKNSQEVALEEKMERHFREAIFLIESTDMEYTQKRYGELSEKEKTGLLFTDKPVEKKSPDAATFEAWKNKDEFAIWIDGKSVANTVLAKYQAKDFVKWFQSGVKANARTARFPQPFQVHLYSPKYFEESFGPNSDMFRPRTNRDTITITQRMLTSMKDLSRYPDPVTAFLQKNARYEKLKASPDASSPEVKQEIQRLFEELESDYAKTPDNRKHRLKKPIAPNAANAGKSVASIPQEKSTYWNLYSKYETKVNRNGLYVKFSQDELAQLEKEYRILDLTYVRLSLEDKMQVKRPSFPFVKLTQGGKIIYKKMEDLTEEEKKNMAC